MEGGHCFVCFFFFCFRGRVKAGGAAPAKMTYNLCQLCSFEFLECFFSLLNIQPQRILWGAKKNSWIGDREKMSVCVLLIQGESSYH